MQFAGNRNSAAAVNGKGSYMNINGLNVYISAAEKLIHEIVGHAIPNAVGSDSGRLIGNAVDNENRVRRENNLPLRPVEPGHLERNK